MHDGDIIRKGNEFLRISVNSDVLISYRGEDAFSYKFFTGGSLQYHPKGPNHIGEEGTLDLEYARKMLTTKDDLGVIGISKAYISTTWKTFKMQLEIVKARDMTKYLQFADVA